MTVLTIIGIWMLLLFAFILGFVIGANHFSKRNNIDTVHSDNFCDYCENKTGRCESLIKNIAEINGSIVIIKDCFSGKKMTPYINISREEY